MLVCSLLVSALLGYLGFYLLPNSYCLMALKVMGPDFIRENNMPVNTSECYKLYGSAASLFTGKARSYLDFKGIPYEEIKSTPQVYEQVIVPRTGVKYIPVVISPDDKAVQDTTDIIDFLEQRFPDFPVYPSSPKQHVVALLLELFGDDWLLLPAMHYRWAYNYDWIVGEFGRSMMPDATEEKQREMAAPAVQFFSSKVPILGITPDNSKAIETSYLALLGHLDKHFGAHDFLLGSRPCIGDFGLIGPMYAHLYRDPASGAIMKEHAPRVAQWVERMINLKPGGEFLDNDEIPETLLPVLNILFTEQFPVLRGTVAAVEAWATSHPNETEVPRMIGKQAFTVCGVEGERGIFPYAQWMLQRPVDFYQSASVEAKLSIDELLSSINAEGALNIAINQRVKRENNIVVVAS